MSGSRTIWQVQKLDVSDLTSVREFAGSWAGPLDVLIKRRHHGLAGRPHSRWLRRPDGDKLGGPFVLTRLLLPSITDRVVSVTSQLHRLAKLSWTLTTFDWRTRIHRSTPAYRDSRLALVLFSLELQRRLAAEGSPVRSALAHPGIARTGLVAHSPSGAIMRLGFLLSDVEHGALPPSSPPRNP